MNRENSGDKLKHKSTSNYLHSYCKNAENKLVLQPRMTQELEGKCIKPRNKKVSFQGQDIAEEKNEGNFQGNIKMIREVNDLVRNHWSREIQGCRRKGLKG